MTIHSINFGSHNPRYMNPTVSAKRKMIDYADITVCPQNK